MMYGQRSRETIKYLLADKPKQVNVDYGFFRTLTLTCVGNSIYLQFCDVTTEEGYFHIQLFVGLEQRLTRGVA